MIIKIRFAKLFSLTSIILFTFVNLEFLLAESAYDITDFYSSLLALIPLSVICFIITRCMFCKVEGGKLALIFFGLKLNSFPKDIKECEIKVNGTIFNFQGISKPLYFSNYWYIVSSEHE